MPRYYTCPTTLAPTPTPMSETTKTSKRIAPQVSAAKTPASLEERIKGLEAKIDTLIDKVSKIDDLDNMLRNAEDLICDLIDSLQHFANNNQQDQWKVTQ